MLFNSSRKVSYRRVRAISLLNMPQLVVYVGTKVEMLQYAYIYLFKFIS